MGSAQGSMLAGLLHCLIGFPTALAEALQFLTSIPALLLHACLDGLSLGNIGWHPCCLRYSALLHILYGKPEAWIFITEISRWICMFLFLHFQDFDSCYALWELSWIPNDSSVCCSAMFIFRPSCAVCYCLIAHSPV